MLMPLMIAVLFLIGCLDVSSVKAQYRISGKRKTEKVKIPEDCSACGIRSRMSDEPSFLVRGGKSVKHSNTYPWLVQLNHKDYSSCGGAILNQYYILTAAHCIKKGKRLDVYFQTSSLYNDTRAYAVEKIIIHPKYSMEEIKGNEIHKYDIALVKLKEKIKCNEYKNAICLPNADFQFPIGAIGIIAGWGNLGPTKLAPVLQHGRVKNLNFTKCIKALHLWKVLKCYMLCAGSTDQAPCYGDSGTPLVYQMKNKFYAVGISSQHTEETCNPKYPAAYIDVVKFLDWIKKEKKA